VRPRILGVLALAAILGTTVILTSGVLKQYQKDRLGTFLEQDQASTSKADKDLKQNLDQAKLAIGSGGVTGKGLFNGPLTRGQAVPEQRTDFIFTAVGEQLGFVGCGALLALLSAIVWRVWRTAQLARDDFGMLICTGIMVMLVERKGSKPAPAQADTVFQTGDKLTVFGDYNAICKAFHAREHFADD
jgi:rod shape determining protein RodA